jgi:hypothetical protein
MLPSNSNGAGLDSECSSSIVSSTPCRVPERELGQLLPEFEVEARNISRPIHAGRDSNAGIFEMTSGKARNELPRGLDEAAENRARERCEAVESRLPRDELERVIHPVCGRCCDGA